MGTSWGLLPPSVFLIARFNQQRFNQQNLGSVVLMGYFLGKIIDEWPKKMEGWEIPEVTGGLVSSLGKPSNPCADRTNKNGAARIF